MLTPEGKPFTTDSIQFIRYKHRIDGLYKKSGNWMSVDEAAAYFGVTKGIIYCRIKDGTIPAFKQRPNWPWRVSVDSEEIEQLKSKVVDLRRIDSINEISVYQASELFGVNKDVIFEAIKREILNAYQLKVRTPWHIIIEENDIEKLRTEIKELDSLIHPGNHLKQT